MNEMLFKSMFYRQFEIEGKDLVAHFDTLRNSLIFSSKELSDELNKKLNEGTCYENDIICKPFYKSKLLVKRGSGDLPRIKEYSDDFLSRKGINIAYFVLTDTCNLNCGYCYCKKGKLSMSKEIVDKSLKVFFDNLNPENSHGYNIYVSGGEPLLDLDLFKYFINTLFTEKKNRGIDGDFYVNIATNGTLITDSLIPFLVKNNISLSVSLDGTELMNNITRPYANGTSSFGDVVRGLKLLRKHDYSSYGISMTVPQATLSTLRKSVDFVFNDLDIKNLTVSRGAMFERQFNSTAEADAYLDYCKEWADTVLDINNTLLENGCCEGRIQRHAKYISNRDFCPYFCAFGCGLVFNSDGVVSNCMCVNKHPYFTLGTVFDKNTNFTKHPFYKLAKNRYTLNMAGCLDCEALGICGGGCAAESLFHNNSVFNKDVHSCFLIKGIVKSSIEKISKSPDLNVVVKN